MLNKIYAINRGLNRRFPDGNSAFKILSRLLEECGELAKDVNHFEDTGIKRQKYGEPDRSHLAKEIQDVLRSTLAIAQYYGVEAELESSVEFYYQRMIAEGLIEEDPL